MNETPRQEVAANGEERKHSMALTWFAGEDSRNLVGLVAYALYKQNLREEIKSGARNPNALNIPTGPQLDFFKSAAEQRLAEFASQAIDEARLEIQESAVLEQIKTGQAELEQHITDSTGFGRAIVTNVAGWLITIGISVLVFLFTLLPGINERIERMLPPDLPSAVESNPNP